MTASRSLSTIYQNTTGGPIELSVGSNGYTMDAGHTSAASFLLSADDTTTVVPLAKEYFDYQDNGFTGNTYYTEPAIKGVQIPDQWYYKITASYLTVSVWWELRP